MNFEWISKRSSPPLSPNPVWEGVEGWANILATDDDGSRWIRNSLPLQLGSAGGVGFSNSLLSAPKLLGLFAATNCNLGRVLSDKRRCWNNSWERGVKVVANIVIVDNPHFRDCTHTFSNLKFHLRRRRQRLITDRDRWDFFFFDRKRLMFPSSLEHRKSIRPKVIKA